MNHSTLSLGYKLQEPYVVPCISSDMTSFETTVSQYIPYCGLDPTILALLLFPQFPQLSWVDLASSTNLNKMGNYVDIFVNMKSIKQVAADYSEQMLTDDYRKPSRAKETAANPAEIVGETRQTSKSSDTVTDYNFIRQHSYGNKLSENGNRIASQGSAKKNHRMPRAIYTSWYPIHRDQLYIFTWLEWKQANTRFLFTSVASRAVFVFVIGSLLFSKASVVVTNYVVSRLSPEPKSFISLQLLATMTSVEQMLILGVYAKVLAVRLSNGYIEPDIPFSDAESFEKCVLRTQCHLYLTEHAYNLSHGTMSENVMKHATTQISSTFQDLSTAIRQTKPKSGDSYNAKAPSYDEDKIFHGFLAFKSQTKWFSKKAAGHSMVYIPLALLNSGASTELGYAVRGDLPWKLQNHLAKRFSQCDMTAVTNKIMFDEATDSQAPMEYNKAKSFAEAHLPHSLDVYKFSELFVFQAISAMVSSMILLLEIVHGLCHRNLRVDKKVSQIMRRRSKRVDSILRGEQKDECKSTSEICAAMRRNGYLKHMDHEFFLKKVTMPAVMEAIMSEN